MPELRRDPIVDRWVIVAENRGDRPGAFAIERSSTLAQEAVPRQQQTGPVPGCPFCPGNEGETPAEVFAVRHDGSERNTPGWRVRVVPNKYPALLSEAAERNEVRGRVDDGHTRDTLFAGRPAAGVHEVIIDTPRHMTRMVELTDDECAESLVAVRTRLLALREEPDLKYALVFKNVGRQAGATREHLHSQLMASAFVPPLVEAEIGRSRRYFDAHGQCVFCRIIAEELSLGLRIVCESERFVALCPYASRFPYEMCILPKRHASHFESHVDGDLADLANLARRAIAKIERLFQPVAYNLVLHNSPFDSASVEHYHWHIEVLPRLTIPAGFEWGSGCAVNPVSPESAAAVLRQDL